jgi:hypothetical protein
VQVIQGFSLIEMYSIALFIVIEKDIDTRQLCSI